MTFPQNGVGEVFFDICHDSESWGQFNHVQFAGLGSAVVLQNVAISVIQHFKTYNVGGFVFQAASESKQNAGRKVSLEETYDYMLGLKNEPRYNPQTGMKKRSVRALLPPYLNAHKIASNGGACYVVVA